MSDLVPTVIDTDSSASTLDAWIASLTDHVKSTFKDKAKELENATKKLKEDTKELEHQKKEFELEKKIQEHAREKATFELEKEREKLRAKHEDATNVLKNATEEIRLKETRINDIADILHREKTILNERQCLFEEKFDLIFKVKSPHQLQTHS